MFRRRQKTTDQTETQHCRSQSKIHDKFEIADEITMKSLTIKVIWSDRRKERRRKKPSEISRQRNGEWTTKTKEQNNGAVLFMQLNANTTEANSWEWDERKNRRRASNEKKKRASDERRKNEKKHGS